MSVISSIAIKLLALVAGFVVATSWYFWGEKKPKDGTHYLDNKENMLDYLLFLAVGVLVWMYVFFLRMFWFKVIVIIYAAFYGGWEIWRFIKNSDKGKKNKVLGVVIKLVIMVYLGYALWVKL